MKEVLSYPEQSPDVPLRRGVCTSLLCSGERGVSEESAQRELAVVS